MQRSTCTSGLIKNHQHVKTRASTVIEANQERERSGKHDLPGGWRLRPLQPGRQQGLPPAAVDAAALQPPAALLPGQDRQVPGRLATCARQPLPAGEAARLHHEKGGQGCGARNRGPGKTQARWQY